MIETICIVVCIVVGVVFIGKGLIQAVEKFLDNFVS